MTGIMQQRRAPLRMRSAGPVTSALLISILLLLPDVGRSQSTPTSADTLYSATIEAGESDAEPKKRRLVKWNEYDGPISTFRVGFGFLVDAATYSQDDVIKEHVPAEADAGLRDFRLLFRGRFKTKRPLSWTLGYMYDGANDEWRFRKTGLMIGVPEILSSVFVGRDKEGYSMVKVMVGYDGWTTERNTALDAFVPILADGIKITGYAPEPRIFWNLGYFQDWVSENESFSTADEQFVARVGFHPVLSEENHRLMHVALMTRITEPDDGKLQARSRPEVYLAPYYVDTGKFAATQNNGYGVEAFYQTGPWILGGEYHLEQVESVEAGDPEYHGGDVALTWLVTGETRPYNKAGSYFRAVEPARTVFEGGLGAVEAVLRLSYINLDSGNLPGGKFWRVTPAVNWHLSENLRLNLNYGYGELDRFGITGGTHFFHLRIQTSL